MDDKEKKAKTYHYLVQKRKSKDDKWEIKLKGGLKAIQLFDTQAEAIEAVKELCSHNNGTYQIRAAIGEGAGKFRKK